MRLSPLLVGELLGEGRWVLRSAWDLSHDTLDLLEMNQAPTLPQLLSDGKRDSANRQKLAQIFVLCLLSVPQTWALGVLKSN